MLLLWHADGETRAERFALGRAAGLVDEIASVYPVDKKRVFLVGHSNGGFMSHRMACDKSERIPRTF